MVADGVTNMRSSPAFSEHCGMVHYARTNEPGPQDGRAETLNERIVTFGERGEPVEARRFNTNRHAVSCPVELPLIDSFSIALDGHSVSALSLRSERRPAGDGKS